VNFIRGELLAMPLQLVNMFGHQHVNSAARHKNNSSSPERVNLLPVELLDKLACHHVNVFTGKHANQFQRQPANPPIWITHKPVKE
jgi:hypothetical protein